MCWRVPAWTRSAPAAPSRCSPSWTAMRCRAGATPIQRARSASSSGARPSPRSTPAPTSFRPWRRTDAGIPLPQLGEGWGWGKRAMTVSHRDAASPSLALPQLGGGEMASVVDDNCPQFVRSERLGEAQRIILVAMPRIEGAGALVVGEHVEADQAEALLPRPVLRRLHQARRDALALSRFHHGQDRDVGAGLEGDEIGRGLRKNIAKALR